MTTPQPTTIEGLHYLPLPTPFNIGRVNAYVVQSTTPGEPLTLIDTGVNSEKAYAALHAGLAALGIQPADLERIIITHHHADHIGLVAQLVAESGAEVLCHPGCVPFAEQPAEARHQLHAWSVTVWQEAAMPTEMIALTNEIFTWFDSLANKAVSVSGTLDDGDTVQMLGRSWQVLHTPGHAGDLICFYAPESGVLLSSDHLIRHISSNALLEPPRAGEKRPRRLVQYMQQMQRIADLKPRIAYAGHGEPVQDVPALVAERLAFHEKRATRILALLRAAPTSLYALTEQMFAHVGPQEKFLALSEVLGHVDLLEARGQIMRCQQNQITYWQAV